MLMRFKRAAAALVGAMASPGRGGSKATTSTTVVQTSGRVVHVDARLIQIETHGGRTEFYYLDEASLLDAAASIETLPGQWVRLLVALDTFVVRSVQVVPEEGRGVGSSRRRGRRGTTHAMAAADR